MRNRGVALLSRFNGFMLLLSFPCYIDYRVCLPPIADEKQQTTPIVYCVNAGELLRGKGGNFSKRNKRKQRKLDFAVYCTFLPHEMVPVHQCSAPPRAGGSARHGRLVRLLCAEL
jgi:hypothetical protein